MDKLSDIGSFENEWKQSKKSLKKKLKFHFWFFQNLPSIALVSLFLLYWLSQMPGFNLFMYRVTFFIHWLLQFIKN